LSINLQEVYRRLLSRFGPQGWWPAETAFEVAVGAILTQKTDWRNAAKAVERLRGAGLLDPEALASTPTERVSSLIRGTGFYREKAERVRRLARFLLERYGGSMERMFEEPLEKIRKELLSLRGIGPETADVILLYAGDKPIFPIDLYTTRMTERLGLEAKSYGELQRLFMDQLPRDVEVYKEMHALIDLLGRRHCRAKPRCEGCPLREPCRASKG
jgi:endonuclease-3 related protein